MNHIRDIECLITTLVKSSRFHALVIESPAGWGKSSTLERVLHELKLEFIAIGAYVTPLALYNALAKNTDKILLLDDSAGLFGDAAGMSVLKAASWTSAGGNGQRVISWNSSSERVHRPEIVFSGKVILLANSIPQGREARAFLSRTLYLKLNFSGGQTAEMLREASKQVEFFENQEVAERVTEALVVRARISDHSAINLRTLQMAYELACTHPDSWQVLLDKLLPSGSPRAILEGLEWSELPVEEQVREFSRLTGLSRRTFFNYRKSGGAASVER